MYHTYPLYTPYILLLYPTYTLFSFLLLTTSGVAGLKITSRSIINGQCYYTFFPLSYSLCLPQTITVIYIHITCDSLVLSDRGLKYATAAKPTRKRILLNFEISNFPTRWRAYDTYYCAPLRIISALKVQTQKIQRDNSNSTVLSHI